MRDAVRDFNHETRKSAELAAREADVEARAYAAWVEARKKGDWESFAPAMEEASGIPSVREHQLVEERVLRDCFVFAPLMMMKNGGGECRFCQGELLLETVERCMCFRVCAF